MKRVIVTGGAGFIGTHLVKRLIEEGYSVIVFDNLSTGFIENLHPKADFIQGDLSVPAEIQKIPADGVWGVFHLAAQSSGERSFENPHADLQTNAGGTLLLLDWCRRNRVGRFLFTSSMMVYGPDSHSPVSEVAPCSPSSFYGIGKLAAENYIRLYGTFGLEFTILRLFNVYGPMQNMNNMKQGMASIYMSFLLRKEPVFVRGSLDRFRDQTYVADVVNGMMLCLDNPVSKGRTYNIATGQKTTVRDLISALLHATGHDENYPVEEGEGTPGDVFGCFADITKARNELHFTCRYDLDSGLREMYEYYKKER